MSLSIVHSRAQIGVDAPAVFRQICRGEIQSDASCRKLETGIDDRASNPVLAFLHSSFRQTDHCQGGQTVSQVNFDGDGGRVYTNLGAAVDDGEGHWSFLEMSGSRFLRVFQG